MTDLTQVDEVLGRSLVLLRSTFRRSRLGGGGWYHQLAEPEPGPTATALGTAMFHLCGADNDHFLDALDFLRVRQLASSDERIDGGWAVNTSQGHPVVEATAWVAWLLGTMNCRYLASSPDLARARSWLVNNQNDDGGWGSLHGTPSRISLTCLAVRGLAKLDPYAPQLDKAVEWLLTQRIPDPCAWGESPAQKPTTTHTAMALLTIRAVRRHWHDDALLRTYDWLATTLDTDTIEDHNSRVESYNVHAGDSRPWSTQLLHYGLPIALSALMRHPDSPPSAQIQRGYETIMRTQLTSGSWPNVMGGQGASIWAVWPFVYALSDLRRRSLVRAADRILWASGVIVVHRREQTSRELAALIRSQRRVALGRWLARYWPTLLVVVSVIGGFALAATGVLEMKDYLLGLIVPIGLYVMQEIRYRRR